MKIIASLSNSLAISTHARERMDARSICAMAIDEVIRYGRVVYANKARIYFVGRREVRHYARQGIDISAWEGIHVVTSNDGVVMTTYRNRDIRHLRPKRRANHAYH